MGFNVFVLVLKDCSESMSGSSAASLDSSLLAKFGYDAAFHPIIFRGEYP
jgi:hypothetical protein